MFFKKVSHAIWRAVLSFFRGVTAWVPTLLIATLGAFYIIDCVMALAAPGTGFDFAYKSQAGIVRVSCETYAIEPLSQSAIVTGLTVRGPDGEIIAQTAQARIFRRHNSVRVDLREAKLTVVRRAGGEVNLQDLLPPADPNAKPTTYRIKIDKVDILYRDLVGEPLQHRFSLKDVAVDSVKGDTYASAMIIDPKAGRLTLSGKARLDGSWQGSLATQRFDLSQVQGPLRRYTRELIPSQYATWQANELLLAGTVTAFAKKPIKGIAATPEFSGKLKIDGKQVTVGKSLQSALIRGTATLQNKRAWSEIDITENRRRATASFVVDWKSQLKASGNFSTQADSSQNLWPETKRLLPAGLVASGLKFGGSFSLDGDEYRVHGELGLGKVRFQAEDFADVKATVNADKNFVTLQIDKSTWRGTGAEGWLSIGVSQDSIAGAFQTAGSGLRRIEFITGENQKLLLAGNATVLVGGKASNPRADVGIKGFANFNLADREIYLGTFDSRITWQGRTAEIQRATIEGPSGVGHVTGTIDTVLGTMNLEAKAGGLDIAAWQDTASGVAYIDGKISGKFESPRFQGFANAYKIQVGEVIVPSIQSGLTLANNNLILSDLTASIGLGEIYADVNINLKNQQVKGLASAENLFVSDMVPGLPVVGSVKVSDAKISGLVFDLNIEALLTSDELIVAGYRLSSGQANFTYVKGLVTVPTIEIVAGDGKATGSAKINVQTMASEAKLEFNEIPLDRIAVDRSTLYLKGTVSGTLAISSPDSVAWVGQAALRPANVELNNFSIGNGSFNAQLAGNILSVSGGIGSTAGFAEIVQLTYDIEDRAFMPSEILVSNLGVAEAMLTVSDKIETPNRRTRQILDTLDGTLSADISISGPVSDILVEVNSAKITEFETLGKMIGEISTAGTWTKHSWILETATWKRGPGLAKISGKGNAENEIELRGELINFDPDIAALLIEDAPEFHALVTSSFQISGKGVNMEGRGTLNLRNIQVRGKNDQLVDVPVLLDSQEIILADNNITALANVSFDGLAATLNATIPLSLFEKEPSGEFEALIVAEDRPISDLNKYLSGIDLQRSVGTVKARVEITGDTKQLNVEGEAKLGTADSPARLVFPAAKTALDKVILNARVAQGILVVTGEGMSSHGGAVDFNTFVGIKALLDGNFGQSLVADLPLSGEVNFKDFRVVERIKLAKPTKAGQKPDFAEASQESEAVWTGKITLGGTGQSPVIGGMLIASNVKAYLPPEFPPSGPGDPPLISPVFDNLHIVAATGTELGVPNGELLLIGDAFITGTLDKLTIRAPLVVESGTFLLPTARIKLEEGGTVTLIAGLGEAAPRVDVNLAGTTTVTLRQASDRYQTYRLNIEIRGDLLDPQGVNISGSSDPPDLSQEEIRAIVGQEDFIRDLVNSALSGNRQNLQEGVFSLALPSLTQGFTADLARSLKLDYLVLDYNAFDGAIIRGGKELARGLLLEASRQISQSPGQQLKYELQLGYRPPIKDKFFSRLRFTLGQNDTVPWRIGLSWTTKF